MGYEHDQDLKMYRNNVAVNCIKGQLNTACVIADLHLFVLMEYRHHQIDLTGKLFQRHLNAEMSHV